MNITKLQTAVACALLCAAPLAWQSSQRALVNRRQTELDAQVVTARATQTDLENRLQRVQQAVELARNESAQAETRLARFTAQRDGQAPRPAYHWDDNSPYVRVPKQLLPSIPVTSVANSRGKLMDQMKDLLQMNDAEAGQTQGALDRFTAAYNAALAQHLTPAAARGNELNGAAPEDLRAFEVKGMGDQFSQARQAMFDELAAALGPERFALFKEGLGNWINLTDDEVKITSSMTAFNSDYRLLLSKPNAGDSQLRWSVVTSHNSMQTYRQADEIPNAVRPFVQDWLSLLAKSPTP